MAVAEEKTSPETSERSWHGIVLQSLKRNDIRLVPYVPDRVLTTLIRNLHADPFFTAFPTAREEAAVGFVSERGTLGEFNYGQSLVCRTMRPVLDSLAMEHHTATRLDEFEFIVDRSI